MKKVFSVLSLLFFVSCFAVAGDEVVHSYFASMGNAGGFGGVVFNGDYPIMLDPTWPDTLNPDFPGTMDPDFPGTGEKGVHQILKEKAAKKEDFSLALEKLVKQNLFDFDSAVISERNHANLDLIADFLNEYKNIDVKIEGHTDNIGSEDYNRRLSERRANAVKNYLVNEGVSANRIKTEGFGYSRPVADNETEEGQAKNRRTEMIFIINK